MFYFDTTRDDMIEIVFHDLHGHEHQSVDILERMLGQMQDIQYTLSNVIASDFGIDGKTRNIHTPEYAVVYTMYHILSSYTGMNVTIDDGEIQKARVHLGMIMLLAEPFYY